jgi:hypothetical protein
MCLRYVKRVLGKVDLAEFANAELFTQVKPAYNRAAFLHAGSFLLLIEALEECTRRYFLIHYIAFICFLLKRVLWEIFAYVQ